MPNKAQKKTTLEPPAPRAPAGTRAEDKTSESETWAALQGMADQVRERIQRTLESPSGLKARLGQIIDRGPTDELKKFLAGDMDPAVDTDAAYATTARLAVLANTFDGIQIQVGSKTFGVGADFLLHYVPFGNRLSQAAHLYILGEAVRWGVPRATLERMLKRIIMDSLTGAIPLLGSVLDGFRLSHSKNAFELLDFVERGMRPAQA